MAGLKTWVFAALVAATPAFAQDTQFPTAAPPVVMVDSERLYTDSGYGRFLRAEVEEQITQLNIENERIIADLTAPQRGCNSMIRRARSLVS